MGSKSNIPVLIAGVALGAVAVLNIAAVSTDTSASGRFQLLAADNHLFKIDTATGQVWETWTSSPSREFMKPNIGTPAATAKNPVAPNLEKGAEK